MMGSSLFGHMEASLAHYLAEITREVRTEDDRAAADLARHELPRVVAALRAVLEEHRPDEHGRCPACRTRPFGRPPAPCRAYLTAHLCLIVTEDDPPTGAADDLDDIEDLTMVSLRNRLAAPG
jgi:hypothetical protein